MEQFTPGSDAFTKEAARRALTGSNNGHIIISDINQGAKFTGSVPWEGIERRYIFRHQNLFHASR
ncbi:MAG TPA: hypothetical protein DCE56_25435 [Cyanobacteria bacterium UBA8553]|nr:hypothetical protein [Cyanobacteria bacterium UBA8553]